MLIQALDQPRRMPTEVDFVLLWSALFLLFFGMVMVYSASIAIAEAGSSGHCSCSPGCACSTRTCSKQT